MLNVFKVSEYLWYTYACISLLSLLDKFKVTSEHVLIIGHCPLM